MPRTATVHTADHGPVTLTCPPWCRTDHTQQDGNHRADLVHEGADVPFVYAGHRLLTAALRAWPFDETAARRPVLAVDLSDGWHTCESPAQVRDLANKLLAHCGVLWSLADELAAVQDGTNRSM
ncbi:DUF6907 domain-containing protein [Streptomyces sp. NPDC006784]|uniref:DUF6907 domain-containing protein n=1 Tax=Streptomyces sp. NPDC006784 TaxID=3364764 RepID=UPI003673E427